MTGRLVITDANLRLDSVKAEGRDLVLDVSAEERGGLAAQLDVTEVESLVVKLRAVRLRGGFRVTGRLQASVVQPSVVSLEPVTQTVDEEVDRVFLPAGEKHYAAPGGAEVFVDLEGEDVPDHFEGAEADLSDLIVETLALGIDPYPRLPGESLSELGIAGLDEAPESPFARLKELKKGGAED